MLSKNKFIEKGDEINQTGNFNLVPHTENSKLKERGKGNSPPGFRLQSALEFSKIKDTNLDRYPFAFRDSVFSPNQETFFLFLNSLIGI